MRNVNGSRDARQYTFGIKPAVRGQIAYRVWFPGDADHTQVYTVNKILTIS